MPYFHISANATPLGKPSPSMTVAYVDALGLEEIKLEIEIWAAK